MLLMRLLLLYMSCQQKSDTDNSSDKQRILEKEMYSMSFYELHKDHAVNE